MPMMGYYGYWDGGWGVLGFLWMIVWWAIIIAAVIALVRWLSRGYSACRRDQSALDILKERYAKGEITKTQFEAMKKDIGE
jgi:putative membrane protein